MIAILVGNGDISPQEENKLMQLLTSPMSEIYAVDGGLNTLETMGVAVNFHLGDFDSSSPNEDDSKIINIPLMSQDQGDFEKSLNYVMQSKYMEIHCFGFDGGRIDHSFNNIDVFLRHARKGSIYFYTRSSKVYYVKDSIKLNVKERSIISIFGFSNCKIARSSGLKYELNGIKLSYGNEAQGISNEAIDKMVELDLEQGEALLFVNY